MSDSTTDGLPELDPRRRAVLLAAGYSIYVLAGPGALTAGGSPLGALGLVPWALACSRPGRYKARLEFLAGALGLTSQVTWMGLVFAPALPLVAVGYGLWAMYPGMLLRRLARCLPLALALPLAWTGFEALIAWTKTPIGLSWLRLGHYLADWPTLGGSARVWGDLGLGFLLAACAGFVADLMRTRRVTRAALAALAVPVGLAAIFTLAWRAPRTVPGPRVLLVQPSFEQKRKQVTGDPEALFADSCALTREALEEDRARGAAPVDLVVWGESMLFATVVEEGLEEVVAELACDPWSFWAELDGEQRVELVRRLRALERRRLLDLVGGALLPEGASFVVGVDGLGARGGRLAGTVGVGLWGPDGARRDLGGKVHLAPGGETMVGLERLRLVREVIYELANYVPDRVPAEATRTFHVEGRDGRSWDLGASVCFDNAYDDPYAGPLRRGPLDAHLVVSNEAWYERTQELDQMVAFSKTLARATGRTLARAANSGISSVFDPEGRELGRVRVAGEDRMVRGALAVTLPVPDPTERGRTTPFVHLQPGLRPGFALLPWLALLLCRLRGRYRPRAVE